MSCLYFCLSHKSNDDNHSKAMPDLYWKSCIILLNSELGTDFIEWSPWHNSCWILRESDLIDPLRTIKLLFDFAKSARLSTIGLLPYYNEMVLTSEASHNFLCFQLTFQSSVCNWQPVHQLAYQLSLISLKITDGHFIHMPIYYTVNDDDDKQNN